MKTGYLIPEFPAQTHVWIWREIVHMREWGMAIEVFSTRPPTDDVRAKHAFAEAAAQDTHYLWPQSPWQLLRCLAWAIVSRPVGFWQTLGLCWTLKLDDRPVWRNTLPLAIVATTLARQAVDLKIQHFHSHTCSRSAILAMMVKRLVGIPFSMTLNANIEWWGGAMGQKFEDAEFTIAITEWLLAQIRSDYPTLAPSKALLGRIGVDTVKWKPQPRACSDQPAIFQVITVGRLHDSKGHDILIRSIQQLVEAGRSVQLTIVGAGPEELELKKLVQTLALSAMVQFTGSLSEEQIIDRLQQSHAFVLASYAEPLGVVYMEAMAMGVPTIGTQAGGVPEIITHEQDGLLVPPNDGNALAQAIAHLMDNPDLRQKLSQNGRRTIVERFDSRLGAATLYERLVGHHPVMPDLPIGGDQGSTPPSVPLAPMTPDAVSTDPVLR